MKKVFALVFTILILLPMLSKSVVYIWFKTNQDYIAKNLCINKDNAAKPDCKGCCVLTEELKKVDEEKTATTNSQKSKDHKDISEFQWNYCLNSVINAKWAEPKSQLLYSYFSSNYCDQYLVDIQKPPCLI